MNILTKASDDGAEVADACLVALDLVFESGELLTLTGEEVLVVLDAIQDLPLGSLGAVFIVDKEKILLGIDAVEAGSD